MPTHLNRREFTVAVGGATLASAFPNAAAATLGDGNEFSFLVLGDTHFDRIEHHDLEWMKQHFTKDLSQVENYCRITQDALPQLLAAAKQQLSNSQPATAFALHVGDLVEGICGNRELAVRHCAEAWDFFKDANLGVPLLMTKGNHDITGPGATEAYAEVLLQKTAAELGRKSLDRTSYSFRHGHILFAVFDAYDRSAIDWLEELVATTEFRQLFVLMHLPVIPYNARAKWRVYDNENLADKQQRLVDLLGQYHAIVLCGHLHKYSVLVRLCRTGKFLQLALSSVAKDSRSARLISGADKYGPELTDSEPAFSRDSLAARKSLLAAEQPFIEYFEYVDNSGFAVISVNGTEIYANIYDSAKPEQPMRSLSMSKLLG